jgi:hypothetical protein
MHPAFIALETSSADMQSQGTGWMQELKYFLSVWTQCKARPPCLGQRAEPGSPFPGQAAWKDASEHRTLWVADASVSRLAVGGRPKHGVFTNLFLGPEVIG